VPPGPADDAGRRGDRPADAGGRGDGPGVDEPLRPAGRGAGRLDDGGDLRTMLVLGIETSTRQTSVALATEQGTVASMTLAGDRAGHELVAPAVTQLLGW